MKRDILINAAARETRVAILEDDRLVELLVDRPDNRRMVGDIYLGKVEAVLPGIQAAFVNIGTEKSAFLHASDVLADESEDPDEDEDDEEPASSNGNGNGNGNGHGRRGKVPAIQEILKRGQDILVQITKEPISTKGPRVTAQISLAGRFLVYIPDGSKVGVSRKISGGTERQRLKELMRGILPEKSGGVIVRTVSEDVTPDMLKRELDSLMAQWRRIKKKTRFVRPPSLIHRETGLTRGLVRDLFKRRCDLPSGGYLIIEQTEALVSIDVNSGRFVGKKDPEKTSLKTNTEAAREIARQLRLRDVGGIIVCDFIDMEVQANRDRVLQELRMHLSRDRARTKAFAVSELGLIEMTRQRVRQSHLQNMTAPCPTCAGTGRIFTPETILRRMERSVRRMASDGRKENLVVRLHPETALHVLTEEQDLLRKLEKSVGFALELRDDPLLKPDEFKLVVKGAGRDVTQQYAVA